ncbi:hypothetical protein AVEN_274524-1, partial [Araneus ventricosus]
MDGRGYALHVVTQSAKGHKIKNPIWLKSISRYTLISPTDTKSPVPERKMVAK